MSLLGKLIMRYIGSAERARDAQRWTNSTMQLNDIKRHDCTLAIVINGPAKSFHDTSLFLRYKSAHGRVFNRVAWGTDRHSYLTNNARHLKNPRCGNGALSLIGFPWTSDAS